MAEIYLAWKGVCKLMEQVCLDTETDFDYVYSRMAEIPPVDVRPAAEILNAVDEAIIFLNNASNQMPYHVYSALYDLIYEICPNCGADMRGGDAE